MRCAGEIAGTTGYALSDGVPGLDTLRDNDLVIITVDAGARS
jgi:hypothetical protein